MAKFDSILVRCRRSFSLQLVRGTRNLSNGQYTVRTSGATAISSVGIRKRWTCSHKKEEQSREAFLIQKLNLLGHEVAGQKEAGIITLAPYRTDSDQQRPSGVSNLINSARKDLWDVQRLLTLYMILTKWYKTPRYYLSLNH